MTQPVCYAVRSLFSQFSKKLPAISTMIDRDDNFLPLSALLSELEQAKALTKAHWGECRNTRKITRCLCRYVTHRQPGG